MYRGCLDIWGVQMPPMLTTPRMPATNVGKASLFNAKFLHLKSWKIIREPPDHIGNEPTPDIPIGGSGQDIKIQNDKYMPFVRNMLIVKHVYHLSTEMEGKKPTIYLNVYQ